MENNYDNLKNLIERLKTITFFQRLFNWKSIRLLLMNALSDVQKLTGNLGHLIESNSELKSINSDLKKDLDLSKTQVLNQNNDLETFRIKLYDQDNQINDFTTEVATNKTNIENQKESIEKLGLLNNGLQINNGNLQKERDELKDCNTKLTSTEENRKQKYENDVATLSSIKDKIEKDRKSEIDETVQAEVDRMKSLKETWAKHQTKVKSQIKAICLKQTIDYIDKVPFKGEPDNTIKICGEFIAIDAKSPASDDLSNFPGYIKAQAALAIKYAKQEGVKKDIFFVVPTNTLECLEEFVYNHADHDVYVISVDSLEQIMLNLKKIESYEFAEKMSPEERDSICRIIGKFVHLTKRRIQIDAYFVKHFLEIAYQAEADLPKDILTKALDFEKAEKLNPPQEKRAKTINLKELDKDSKKLNSEINAKGIVIDDNSISEGINKLQLYVNDPEASTSAA